MEPHLCVCTGLTTLDVFYFSLLQMMQAVDADMSSYRHKHTEVTQRWFGGLSSFQTTMPQRIQYLRHDFISMLLKFTIAKDI